MWKSVNWEDPALKRWLGTIVRPGTRYIYRTAFKAYALFTGMTGSALIDEALVDARKDPREKEDIVMARLVDFYNWLKEEYPRKSRGRGKRQIIGKGISDKLTHTYWCHKKFLRHIRHHCSHEGKSRLPKPKVANKRMRVNAEDVKVLVDHARTPRDIAIVAVHFGEIDP